MNCYALEVITKARLAELHAEAARRVVLASLRPPQAGVWATLRFALQRVGRRRSGREIVSPRPA